jgi:hypothetical protein
MSILDKASLIQIPSGYKEDKLYSVKPRNGEGDFTFTRASTGTRVNADGYIEEVAWNQLTYSEDFSSWNTWRQGAALPVTVTTDVTESPIGTLTADRIQCDQVSLGGSNRVGVRQDVTYAPLQRFTISVWAKSASGSDESFKIVARNAAGITPGSFTATNEWQKFSRVVEMRDPAVTVNVIIGLFQNTDTTTTDIYLWGAQIVLGETEKTYIKTTDRLDVPRLDYSGGATNPTLLLEGQRTNEVAYSEDYSTGWSKSNTTTIARDAISPDGLGNASKIYPNSSGNYRHIRNPFLSPSSGLYTFSIFAKAGELDHLVLIDYDGSGIGIDFDLTNGVATDNATSPFDNVDMIDYGDGWYRCIATATDMYFYWILSDNGGLSVTANGTDGLFIWGAMAETGSYPTSYIPTSGTSVTRVADVCDDAGDATIFNDSEGCLFVEIAALADDLTSRVISLNDGSTSNRVIILYQTITSAIRVIVSSGGSIQFDSNTQSYDITNFNKIALKYKENDFALWINGTEVSTDISGLTPIGLNNLEFNNANGTSNFFGKCKQLIYFNEALTDTELEELTTI